MARPNAVTGLVALALGVAVTGAAGAQSQATRIQLSAALTAAQEVPAPEGNVAQARGAFTGTLTRTAAGASLAWRLSFAGLTGPATAAHLHVAPRGQAGPVAVALCAPCESGAGGAVEVTEDAVAAVQAGRAYVNVHTQANPAGEVRGQLATVARIRTTLDARQEVPRPRGRVGRATGRFTATVRKTGTTATVVWRLTFGRLTGKAIAAHVHTGARGRSGAVAVALCSPCRSGARGRLTLRGPALAALEAGRAYVNVHTRRNRAGEIRGQIAKTALTLAPAPAPPPADGGGGYYP